MNRRDFGRIGVVGLAGMALPRTGAWAQGGTYRYVHVDVFTDRRLQGNQLLVFVQPAGLDVDRMQALTRESNYSECTFAFPPEAAGTDQRQLHSAIEPKLNRNFKPVLALSMRWRQRRSD